MTDPVTVPECEAALNRAREALYQACHNSNVTGEIEALAELDHLLDVYHHLPRQRRASE